MREPIGTADYVEIQRLIHRYADAVVHRDGVQWASCWAEQATWDLGRGRLVEGRDAIVDAVVRGDGRDGLGRADGPQRRGVRRRQRRRAPPAAGTSTSATGAPTAPPAILLAHYDDGYARVDGRWLFSRRFLQSHYTGPPDLSAEFTNQRDGPDGSRRACRRVVSRPRPGPVDEVIDQSVISCQTLARRVRGTPRNRGNVQ